MTTPDLIATLERLHATMTPGEWRQGTNWDALHVYGPDDLLVVESRFKGKHNEDADASGIAALRNLLPAIIAALKAGKQAREALSFAQMAMSRRGPLPAPAAPCFRIEWDEALEEVESALAAYRTATGGDQSQLTAEERQYLDRLRKEVMQMRAEDTDGWQEYTGPSQ